METKKILINMSEQNINKASEEVRADLKEGYIKFMKKRFPHPTYYTHLNYALEWAERFNSGNVLGYCDGKSKMIIKDIFKGD